MGLSLLCFQKEISMKMPDNKQSYKTCRDIIHPVGRNASLRRKKMCLTIQNFYEMLPWPVALMERRQVGRLQMDSSS